MRNIVAAAVAGVLVWSFWYSSIWLQLCAGLAMFLFGMQLLEDGLRKLAGGQLEQWLARSTGTKGRGLLFGIGASTVLQSSTLVSLLAIAFAGAGLIGLAGGMAMVLGAKLGTLSSIWLLALAGQDFSLSPLALPLLVFGVLLGFTGPRGKAAGRVLLGVAFIFLGIDQIKSGFASPESGFGLTVLDASGLAGILALVMAGLLATMVLQSSHGSLILVLAAMAAGHLPLLPAMVLMIGVNIGSGISTAVVGLLGASRSGQRMALARLIFNTGTSLVTLALLLPMHWLVGHLAQMLGLADKPLLQLALFLTLFNGLGVALFWPLQEMLADRLIRFLPEKPEPAASLPEDDAADGAARIRARYLSDSALESADAAAAAVSLELRHLEQRCLDVICWNLGYPCERLSDAQFVPDDLYPVVAAPPADASVLYQHHVKGVYADLLAFMGRREVDLGPEHQQYWQQAQLTGWQLVNAVKDTKHLQKNFRLHLAAGDSATGDAYLALWRELFRWLHGLCTLGLAREIPDDGISEGLAVLVREAGQFVAAFREHLFRQVREGVLDGFQAGSLMNDLGYAEAIFRHLCDAMAREEEPVSLRQFRRVAVESQAPATG